MGNSSIILKQYSTDLTAENVRIDLLIGPRANDDTINSRILHRHVYCEVILCSRGQVFIHHEKGTPVVLSCGDLALIPPQLSHICIGNTAHAEDFRFDFISFYCTPLQNGTKKDLYRLFLPFFRADTIHTLHMETLSDDLAAAERAVEVGDTWTASAILFKLLVCIAEQYSRIRSDEEPSEDITQLTRLDRIINAGYTENLTIDTVAERMFLSRRQLSRVVKKYYGMTLNRLLTEKRLTAAEHLLLTTDISVDETAVSAGFGSTASFYRRFTEKYGVPPAEYRAQSRKKTNPQ